MTLATIDVILDRISIATSASPIAVFQHTDKSRKSQLVVCFANTVKTRNLIRTQEDTLVGIYDKSLSRDWTLHKLQQAVFRQCGR